MYFFRIFGPCWDRFKIGLTNSFRGLLQNYPFDWEPDADGFRGHLFVASDNSTVVISIKGTSLAGGGGPTVIKDKITITSC
jgi:putative lipase involved disintegration of autophagic bodies